jgi:hypothetical protein
MNERVTFSMKEIKRLYVMQQIAEKQMTGEFLGVLESGAWNPRLKRWKRGSLEGTYLPHGDQRSGK